MLQSNQLITYRGLYASDLVESIRGCCNSMEESMSSESIPNSDGTPTTCSEAGFIEVQLTPIQARAILARNTSPDILVMCRGYNSEDDQFTELVWADDADLDFEDQVSYPEFQLWVRLSSFEQPKHPD
jgi:hypothetical protein